MSVESDVRDIKNNLNENKRSLTEVQRDIQAMKVDIKKLQESSENSFFTLVKGTAMVSAISKISTIEKLLEEIKKNNA